MGERLALVVIVGAALCICLLGCADNDDGLVEGTGTVTWLSFEGGFPFYGLAADDHEHYDPINLPEEFREDGLRVWFTARIRNDVVSWHIWGRSIELLEIERL